jgi:hypothetical protein
MALCFVASTLVSGILQSFPELSALLVAEGVFAAGCGDVPQGTCAQQNDTLSKIYYVAVGLSVTTTLIVGQVFDSFGSRTCGVVGGIGALLALFLMFSGAHVPHRCTHMGRTANVVQLWYDDVVFVARLHVAHALPDRDGKPQQRQHDT